MYAKSEQGFECAHNHVASGAAKRYTLDSYVPATQQRQQQQPKLDIVLMRN